MGQATKRQSYQARKETSYPSKSRNHFFGQILSKLADNVYNGKSGIPLFKKNFKNENKGRYSYLMIFEIF
jgi:hypothetical protein